MSVTIRDIARAAGVSPSTVSRVINGNKVISLETREKILRIMEEMDYHPNSLARNLANGSTGCIGLIMDARDERSYSNGFFDRSVYAIEKVAQAKGYTLLIASDDSSAPDTPAERLVLEKKADGLLLPPSVVRPGLITLLEENGCPFVVLGEPGRLKNKTCWVDADNEEGGRIAVQHLTEQGCERIAFLAGDLRNVFVQNRIKGYEKGIAESGGQADPSLIVECRTAEAAEGITDRLLDLDKKPDAFLCSDNVIAWHVMQALKQRSWRIPQDAAIVTFDDYPFARYLDPPLTAVDVDTYGIGEQAAYQLLRQIHRADSVGQHTLVSSRLLVRMSSIRKG